jgi:pyruvate/2-oxoglutarate dehydrogenase complex dihydrolipoamide dehydrogenase (E3) component
MTLSQILSPDDEFNRALGLNCRPPDWQNPLPAQRYNLVVIGAGTAGLITAIGAAELGARVALCERELMGGDCLNVGCVPSKALIRSARAVAQARNGAAFGVQGADAACADFAQVMQRLRRLRSQISPNDSAERYRERGVDVFFGEARFTGPKSVDVAGQKLNFSKAAICTGARAAQPDCPGLQEAGFLTNETVFSLTSLPPRLAVLGAGPIGCELAQAFARLGSAVALIGTSDRILPREDAVASERVARSLSADGIRLHLSCRLERVTFAGGSKRLHLAQRGGLQEIVVDEIVAGVGRVPNVDSLDLSSAGVAWTSRDGVLVDDWLRTTNRHIYAAGDVCSNSKFTHAADAMARVVIQNALFRGRARASALIIPRCTYTDPEVAHVGLTEREAREQGLPIDTFVQELHDVDRALLDGETEGFLKVHVQRGTDRIAGATLVSSHAGESISEITLAMVARIGLRTLARTIHPYPTQAEAIKRIADAYNRSRLTPLVKSLLSKWLALSR